MGHRLRPFTPALYHGTPSSRPYFEGWYFKLAHPEHPIAVIPGVFRGTHSDGDMSFVQVLFGPGNKSVFLPFPFSAFSSDENRFAVAVGENRFSMDGMRFRLEKDGFSLRGETAFSRHRLPRGPAWGPFAWRPKIRRCPGGRWLKPAGDGTLFLNGTKLDAQGSCGYIEKDWGSAFPPSWMWLQGNGPGQNGEDVAFTCSVARIPYGPFRFTGHVAVLSVGNRHFRMATYNGQPYSAAAHRRPQRRPRAPARRAHAVGDRPGTKLRDAGRAHAHRHGQDHRGEPGRRAGADADPTWPDASFGGA